VSFGTFKTSPLIAHQTTHTKGNNGLTEARKGNKEGLTTDGGDVHGSVLHFYTEAAAVDHGERILEKVAKGKGSCIAASEEDI